MLDAVEGVLDSIEFAAEDVNDVSLVLVSGVLVEVVPLESVVCMVDTELVSADVTVELCRDPELEPASDERGANSVALDDSVVVSEVVDCVPLVLDSSVLVEVDPLESVDCIVDTELVSADVAVELCKDTELASDSDEGDPDSVALDDTAVVSEVVETLWLFWAVEDIDVSEVVPGLELD